jgi:hypothetical protein
MVVTKPDGVVSGTLLVHHIWCGEDTGGNLWTAPAGWTTIMAQNYGTSLYSWIFYKVAGGSEGANYTFSTTTGSVDCAGVMYAISGCDTATPINTGPSARNDNQTSGTAPALTTTRDGCLVFCSTAANLTVFVPGTPSGTTATNTESATDLNYKLTYYSKTTAGSTGTKNFSGTGLIRKFLSAQIAINPPATFTPTGVSIPVTLGSFTGKNIFAPTGISIPVTLGSFTADEGGLETFTPTGIAIPVTLGAFSGAEPTATVFTPSGISISVTLGAFTGELASPETTDHFVYYDSDEHHLVVYDSDEHRVFYDEGIHTVR